MKTLPEDRPQVNPQRTNQRRRIAKPKVTFCKHIAAFTVKFPNKTFLWTSARLVDAWPDRPAGQLVHPLLSGDCAGSA